MPRTEQPLMTGWEFAPEGAGELAYTPVRLPHDWAISAPFDQALETGGSQGFRNRWGVGWYRKTLVLTQVKPGYRYYLAFGGIYENSTIWVNGKKVGGRAYGYSSFETDITGSVGAGENQILIKVDNTAHPADRWYSGAGLYRGVKLIEVESRHLDARALVVRTEVEEEGGCAVVSVDAGVRAQVRVSLTRAGTTICGQGEAGVLSLDVTGAALWSAETPNLYDLKVELLDGARVADSISIKIGLRKMELRPGEGLFLNGAHGTLKGVCVHQDIACCGIAAPIELWRERLLNLKELGCNAIRAAHHTFCEEFLDLCDELGFYVYEECFDKWTGGAYARYFETDWRQDLAAMIERDRNHPCILLWGVGNEVENQGQDSMLAILKMLVDAAHQLDPTRPVTCALNPHFKREGKISAAEVKDIQQFVDEVDDREIYDMEERLDRIEKIAAIVDVLACNYQEQWYDAIHARLPDKLILGTEIYQYFKGHPDQLKNFTEEPPALVPLTPGYDYVIGGMIWTGFDYLGESMGWPAKGWSGAPIRSNNRRRPNYYLLQSYWSAEPMVHFSVLDGSLADEGVKELWDAPMYADHWEFPQFHKVVIPYAISTNCDEVELYLNGERYYLPKPADCKNHRITGYLPYFPGTVRVVGYKDGIPVCSHETVTPGPAVKLVFEPATSPECITTGWHCLLTVHAADESGVYCFRQNGSVRFSVEGPAEIVAVDNGSLMGDASYQADAICLANGSASVLLFFTGAAGKVIVRADAENLRGGAFAFCREG